MILADKIIALRKKNGWSQEELADKMNVSRQSVSKWEGAQSVPDLEKILRMANLFGVSTDYLLKDEMGEAEYVDAPDEDEPPLRRVSMEEANEFLRVKYETSKSIALATFMCILSPICLLLLTAASETGALSISEDFAGGIGLCVMILIIAPAVAIYIYSGSKTSLFEYLEQVPFETEYGVSGMVKERQEQYRDTYTRYNVIGTTFCILSVIPLFIGSFATEDDFYLIGTVCALLVLVAIGVIFFITAGIRWESMQKLLQEGNYTKVKKTKKQKGADFTGTVATVYWMLATAIYVGDSLRMDSWGDTWIIWPIAGIVFVAVMAVSNLIEKKIEVRE